MKFSFGELLDLNSKLPNLFEQKLKFATIYKIEFLLKQIKDPLSFLESKRREIIKEYAENDESGKMILDKESLQPVFKEENREVCIQKLTELINTEIDIDIKTFNIEEFDDIKIQMTEISHVFMDKLVIAQKKIYGDQD